MSEDKADGGAVATTEDDEKRLLEEICAGGGLALDRVGKLFGNAVPVNTVRRWVKIGVKVRDGLRVRMGAIRLGGRWMTSKAEVQRFLAATNSKGPTVPQ